MLAAAALVFGFVLFKDISAQRNRVRTLEAQVAQLRREMMADTTASQSVTSDTTAPASESPAQAAALLPSASSTPTVTKPATAANNEWRAVLADPAYRQARLAEARLELQRGYPHLIAELGLSADEAERFLDLLAEQSLRENEREMKKQPGQDPMKWAGGCAHQIVDTWSDEQPLRGGRVLAGRLCLQREGATGRSCQGAKEAVIAWTAFSHRDCRLSLIYL